jgi:serum/glucocorticoid-regulated kinase 2
MSWLSRSKKPTSHDPHVRTETPDTRSTTPTPHNSDGKLESRTGLLTIRVIGAEGLGPPSGIAIPPAVQSALSSQRAKLAASVSPSSVTQQRLAKGRGSRDSIQRTQCWWLPYLVMEFEVNQVLITPLGGKLEQPLYMYQAHL